MQLNSGTWPRFIVQRSVGINGTEHQMSVSLDLQGWNNGPITFDEEALKDLFRAARTFMEAHTEGQTLEFANFTIQENWGESLEGLESVLEESA